MTGHVVIAAFVLFAPGLKSSSAKEIGLEGENNSRETLISPVDPEIGYPEELLNSKDVK